MITSLLHSVPLERVLENSSPLERVFETPRGGFRSDDSDDNESKKRVVSRIEDPGLQREAERACRNSKVQRDVNHMAEQLSQGNQNPGTGSKSIHKDIVEHRGKRGGRLYVRESNGEIEIVAKSSKRNQDSVIKRLKVIYK